MIGITSYGAYVPRYRLSRDLIAKAWRSTSTKGEKAVANYDEDTTTMASEAIFDCLAGFSAKQIDGLLFATTTPAYSEGHVTSLLAKVADMRRDIFTEEPISSLRGATTALRSALASVKADAAKRVMVVAADCRLGEPGSASEQLFGDGAAAVVVGDSDVIAEVEGTHSLVHEIDDTWRLGNAPFPESFNEKLATNFGYDLAVTEAVRSLLEKQKLQPSDIAKVAVNGAAELRGYHNLMARLEFNKEQVQDPQIATVGNTGAAQPLMMLVAALEQAKPGDRILLVGYHGGADAFILRVTENIERAHGRRGLSGWVAKRREMPTYETYLRFRGLVEKVPSPERPASAIAMYRDQLTLYSLYAAKCLRCGTVAYPIERVCGTCMAKDNSEAVPLPKEANVFAATRDSMVAGPDGQPTAVAILEFDNGCRLHTSCTDADADNFNIGDRVEMTFRKLFDGGGSRKYWWKARPAR